MMKKLFIFALAAMTLVACNQGDVDDENQPVSTIPSDDDADPNPTINDTTVTLPGVTASFTSEEGEIVIRLDMTGVMDPSTGEYLKLYGTGSSRQNVWVEVDDEPKGISVTNLSDGSGKAKADVIFLVDNSGSMDEEADSVANGINAWSKLLVKSGFDVRFGIVGYDGEITGALDITKVEDLSNFLQYSYGRYRTAHFDGSNAYDLQSQAPNYYNGGYIDECGMAAFHFANDNFHFRTGASRVYVNFTDEPNYYFSTDKFRTSWLKNNWKPAMGTIHCVYSDGEGAESWTYEYEGSHDFPWRMAEYTGGTKLFVNPYFTGVNLKQLPVTDAMQNSYIIKLTNVTMDNKTHKVRITVKSKDGSVAGEIVMKIKFSTK